MNDIITLNGNTYIKQDKKLNEVANTNDFSELLKAYCESGDIGRAIILAYAQGYAEGKSTAKSVKTVKRKRRTNERINQSNLRKRPSDSIRT